MTEIVARVCLTFLVLSCAARDWFHVALVLLKAPKTQENSRNSFLRFPERRSNVQEFVCC